MDLRRSVLECRTAIRSHRDEKGDDRCWIDDYAVWGQVPGLSQMLTEPPPFENAMAICRDFYRLRRAATCDPVPAHAITDPKLWDADLDAMTDTQLGAELERLHAVIRTHHAADTLTIDDDRALYTVLPEKMPADFRLPPEHEFLGEAKAPHAGCPSFWRSHKNCPTSCHTLSQWGVCGDNKG